MRLRVSVVRIVTAAFFVIGLAACGSSSAKSSSVAAATSVSVASTTTSVATANFNSCSVVTQAQAASAIGQAVTPGVSGSATVEGGLVCVFYGPSALTNREPNVAQPDSVRVVVVKGSEAMTQGNRI